MWQWGGKKNAQSYANILREFLQNLSDACIQVVPLTRPQVFKWDYFPTESTKSEAQRQFGGHFLLNGELAAEWMVKQVGLEVQIIFFNRGCAITNDAFMNHSTKSDYSVHSSFIAGRFGLGLKDVISLSLGSLGFTALTAIACCPNLTQEEKSEHQLSGQADAHEDDEDDDDIEVLEKSAKPSTLRLFCFHKDKKNVDGAFTASTCQKYTMDIHDYEDTGCSNKLPGGLKFPSNVKHLLNATRAEERPSVIPSTTVMLTMVSMLVFTMSFGHFVLLFIFKCLFI